MSRPVPGEPPTPLSTSQQPPLGGSPEARPDLPTAATNETVPDDVNPTPREVARAAAATNGPDLALRSPAPAPVPDHDEQLVVVRRAIYDARTQAGHWRQVIGVDNASEMASRRDRDADVLEHVLRWLIGPTVVEDIGMLVGGERRNFRLEVDGREGRVIIRLLGVDVEDNRVLDIDMLTATDRLLRSFGHV